MQGLKNYLYKMLVTLSVYNDYHGNDVYIDHNICILKVDFSFTVVCGNLPIKKPCFSQVHTNSQHSENTKRDTQKLYTEDGQTIQWHKEEGKKTKKYGRYQRGN